MKQYIYTPEELGINKFSEGTLRLEGVEETRDPDQADVFVCPEALFNFKSSYDLPIRFYHMITPSRSSRHVFLDVSDHMIQYNNTQAMFIRVTSENILKFAPNCIPWSWPVHDYKECMPMDNLVYDITFHGWLSCLARKVAANTCHRSNLLKSDIRGYKNFFGHMEVDRQREYDQRYRHSMRQSRLCLTVESIPGILPYRFFEAMSAGRPQVYVGRGHKLPFENEIPYHQFVEFVDIDMADEVDRIANEYLDRHSSNPTALKDKGYAARRYWEQYLSPAVWNRRLVEVVESKIKTLG